MLLACTVSFILFTFRQVASISYLGIFVHSIFVEYRDISMVGQLPSRSLQVCAIITDCADTLEVGAISQKDTRSSFLSLAHSLF